MLRTQGPRPICPMCEEPGVHGSMEACLVALRAARAALVQRLEVIGVRVIGRERKRIIGFKRPKHRA